VTFECEINENYAKYEPAEEYCTRGPLDELCQAEAVKGVMEFVCRVESARIANTNGLEFSEVILLC
jgi:hypothetical protein